MEAIKQHGVDDDVDADVQDFLAELKLRQQKALEAIESAYASSATRPFSTTLGPSAQFQRSPPAKTIETSVERQDTDTGRAGFDYSKTGHRVVPVLPQLTTEPTVELYRDGKSPRPPLPRSAAMNSSFNKTTPHSQQDSDGGETVQPVGSGVSDTAAQDALDEEFDRLFRESPATKLSLKPIQPRLRLQEPCALEHTHLLPEPVGGRRHSHEHVVIEPDSVPDVQQVHLAKDVARDQEHGELVDVIRTLQSRVLKEEAEKTLALQRIRALEDALAQKTLLPFAASSNEDLLPSSSASSLEKIKMENMLIALRSKNILLLRQLEQAQQTAETLESERDQAWQEIMQLKQDVHRWMKLRHAERLDGQSVAFEMNRNLPQSNDTQSNDNVYQDSRPVAVNVDRIKAQVRNAFFATAKDWEDLDPVSPPHISMRTSEHQTRHHKATEDDDKSKLFLRDHPNAFKELLLRHRNEKLPFLLGRSAQPSFSLPANVQQVRAQLKAHSTGACSICTGDARHASTAEQQGIRAPSSMSHQRGMVDSLEVASLLDLKRLQTELQSSATALHAQKLGGTIDV